MSRLTDPENQQSVTCGFYNSTSGDRKYDATQMSAIFDGIIRDGVFATIGNAFAVTCITDDTGAYTHSVSVDTGKAWFNHTWTLNDAPLRVSLDGEEHGPHDILNRIDAIVIEVNSTDAVRDNSITVVHGVPASNPTKPTMIRENGVYQYAICYITRKTGSTGIEPSDIEYVVGDGKETPFITGPLKVLDADAIIAKWKQDLDNFVINEKKLLVEETDEMKQLAEDIANEFSLWTDAQKNAIVNWTEAQKNTILDWFDNMKDQLSEDSAANLQIQIDENEIKHILIHGFVDGTKTFSTDGTIITSTDPNGRKLVKTFTNNFSVCTTVLTNEYGIELGRQVKTFSDSGDSVDITTSF